MALSELFMIETTPEELSEKMWADGKDASWYYQDSAASAEWAIFIGTMFDGVEYYVLDGKGHEKWGDTPEFFCYVMIDGNTFDVSGWHADHEAIIGDNNFYESDYGEITYRKITETEAHKLSGTSDPDDLFKYLFGDL